MSRTPLDLNDLPRTERQKSAECAVQGCDRCPRAFSRYCTIHARNFHRTRDPNGRAVRIRELKPYLKLADEYLKRNAQHPAVLAAEEFLRVNLTDSTMPSDIRKQLQRLSRDGAEPRDMLVNFLAVMGLRNDLPHTITTDACEAFNIGNRVLRTTPVPSFQTWTGKRQPARIPARVAEAYGLFLRRSALGLFSNQFWTVVQKQLNARIDAGRAVSKAIRETPLT